MKRDKVEGTISLKYLSYRHHMMRKLRASTVKQEHTIIYKKLRTKPTSIEPQSQGLLVRLDLCLNKMVKQTPSCLDIHINIPSILSKLNLRLSRQFHNQILNWVPLHINPQQHQQHNQNPTKPTMTHLRNSQDTHKKPHSFIHSLENSLCSSKEVA